ncbi:hypothetical protein LTR95_003434, partial [Oleoguttula sp. CCFEE 5521]
MSDQQDQSDQTPPPPPPTHQQSSSSSHRPRPVWNPWTLSTPANIQQDQSDQTPPPPPPVWNPWTLSTPANIDDNVDPALTVPSSFQPQSLQAPPSPINPASQYHDSDGHSPVIGRYKSTKRKQAGDNAGRAPKRGSLSGIFAPLPPSQDRQPPPVLEQYRTERLAVGPASPVRPAASRGSDRLRQASVTRSPLRSSPRHGRAAGSPLSSAPPTFSPTTSLTAGQAPSSKLLPRAVSQASASVAEDAMVFDAPSAVSPSGWPLVTPSPRMDNQGGASPVGTTPLPSVASATSTSVPPATMQPPRDFRLGSCTICSRERKLREMWGDKLGVCVCIRSCQGLYLAMAAYVELLGVLETPLQIIERCRQQGDVPRSGLVRAVVSHQPPEQGRRVYGPNYWIESQEELLSRGPDPHGTKETIIRGLQIADAKVGLLPRPRPLPSRYHYMYSTTLMATARRAGWRKTSSMTGAESLDVDMSDAEEPAEEDENQLEAARSAISYMLDYDWKNDVDYWFPVDDPSERQALVNDLSDSLLIAAQLGLGPRSVDTVQSGDLTHLRQIRQGQILGITGSEHALAALEPLVRNEMVYPTDTSADGLLCGAYALEESLHTMRRIDRRLRNLDPPRRISYIELMRLLFVDWQPGAGVGFQSDDVVGTPTDAYDAYLRQTYGGATDAESEVIFQDLRQELLRTSNLDAIQLQAMLSLLHRNGRIDIHYQLGVIASAHTTVGPSGTQREHAAHVRFVDEYDITGRRVPLFVHNNIAFGDGYNHFEGMTGFGAGDIHTVLSWGLRIHDADLMAKSRFSITTAALSDQEVKDREKKNESVRRLHQRKKAGAACTPCHLAGTSCTGNAKESGTCPECEALGQICEWEEDQMPLPGYETLQPGADYDRWQVPFHADWWNHNIFREPAPTGKYFYCFFIGRVSSNTGPMEMRDAARRLQRTQHHYDNYLNSGRPEAEAQRPIGPGSTMRAFRMIFARHGTMAIPTTATNLQSPELQAFVAECDALFSYQQPLRQNPPDEIQLVLNGFAGFSVGIRHWGSRVPNDGFFGRALQQDNVHGTNLAARIWVVIHVEDHVVNGRTNNSITHPNRAAEYH